MDRHTPTAFRPIVRIAATLGALALATASVSPVWADAPQIPHLAAYLPGDGNATEVVHGAAGAMENGATFVAGRRGQAFSFDGSDEAATSPSAAWQFPAASFSVVAWVRTSLAAGIQLVVEEYECANYCPNEFASSVWELMVVDGHASAFVREAMASGGAGSTLVSSASIADGAWHHVGAVRDSAAGKLRLYVDGALDQEATLDPTADGPLSNDDGEADPVIIGAHILGGTNTREYFFNGEIDEIGFYETALTSPEMARVKGLAPAGLRLDNLGPTVNADSATVGKDAAASAIDVLANDVDPEGNPITIASSTVAAHGTAICSTSGCSYTPAAGYSGADSFSYSATDGDGTASSATVSITVAAEAGTTPAPTLESSVAGATDVPTITLPPTSTDGGPGVTQPDRGAVALALYVLGMIGVTLGLRVRRRTQPRA